MTTVPKVDTPPPADNSKTLTLQSDSKALYARPTAGGNAAGVDISGKAVDAPAGPVPSPNSVNVPGAPPSTGGTQVGPDMGHGATIILTGISGGGDTDNDGDTL
jgi:hypothetical protein